MPVPVTLTFPVCVNMSSGDVEIFGQDVTTSNKAVIFDLSMNYLDISGMFTYIQQSNNPNDVTVNPTAGFDYRQFVNDTNLVLNRPVSIDTTTGYSWWPNAQDSRKADATSPLFHYDDIYNFILATVAYNTFSHPLAQAALNNDYEIIKSCSDSKIAANLATAIQNLSEEQCKVIFQEMVKQDPSRFSKDDTNSTEQPVSHPVGSPQTLVFLPGDRLQFEFKIKGYNTYRVTNPPSEPSAGTMWPIDSSWTQLGSQGDEYYTAIVKLENVPQSNVKVFNVGDVNTFTVPTGVSTLHVELWGAGGGGGKFGGYGGAGAYVKGDLAVTAGETLKVIVGKGGANGGVAGTEDEGAGGGTLYNSADNGIYNAGSGGGRSAIQRAGDDVVTAGGGGGGALGMMRVFLSVANRQDFPYKYEDSTFLSTTGGAAHWQDTSEGGYNRDDSSYNASLGASQSAGGANGGAKYTGATSTTGSGGGGGGYYGGGVYPDDVKWGGGAGSSYTANLTNATGADGFGFKAPKVSSPYKVWNVAEGGVTGNNGLVVISWD